jgi:hypothetical protein
MSTVLGDMSVSAESALRPASRLCTDAARPPPPSTRLRENSEDGNVDRCTDECEWSAKASVLMALAAEASSFKKRRALRFDALNVKQFKRLTPTRVQAARKAFF